MVTFRPDRRTRTAVTVRTGLRSPSRARSRVGRRKPTRPAPSRRCRAGPRRRRSLVERARRRSRRCSGSPGTAPRSGVEPVGCRTDVPDRRRQDRLERRTELFRREPSRIGEADDLSCRGRLRRYVRPRRPAGHPVTEARQRVFQDPLDRSLAGVDLETANSVPSYSTCAIATGAPSRALGSAPPAFRGSVPPRPRLRTRCARLDARRRAFGWSSASATTVLSSVKPARSGRSRRRRPGAVRSG